MIHKYKDRHIQIMEQLWRYEYLTVKQILIIWIWTRSQNLVRPLAELQMWKSPMINCIKFWVIPWIWKLSYIYYLKKAWVRFLEEHLWKDVSRIKYPKSRSTYFQRDYFHRVSTIDFHIKLIKEFRYHNKHIEPKITLNNVFWYFDKSGSNRSERLENSRVKTRIDLDSKRYIIPDGVIVYTMGGRRETLLVELSNGKNTKKIFNQLLVHALAISRWIPKKLFNTERDTRVLCLFEHESIKNAVASRLSFDKRFERFKEHFLFKTYNEAQVSILYGWMLFDWEEGGIFLEKRKILPTTAG